MRYSVRRSPEVASAERIVTVRSASYVARLTGSLASIRTWSDSTAELLPVVSSARARTVCVPSPATRAEAVAPAVRTQGASSTETDTDSTPVASVAVAVARTGSVTHQPSSPSAVPAARLTTGSAASVTVTVATGRSAEPRTTVPVTVNVPGAAYAAGATASQRTSTCSVDPSPSSAATVAGRAGAVPSRVVTATSPTDSMRRSGW